jgi:hypothetical protein
MQGYDPEEEKVLLRRLTALSEHWESLVDD